MKRILSILLITMMILMCFAGCGKDNEPANTDTPSTPVSDKETQTSEETISKEDTADWGVQNYIVTEKNDIFTTANIKFPTSVGHGRGSSDIARQEGGAVVILDDEHGTDSPALSNDSCENVFPAYFEQTKLIIEFGNPYDDSEFSITNKETVTVNGYEMCKFTGKYTGTVYGENVEMGFVAYATKLNGNGAYVYWMVLDDSEDQSLTATIEEYADKMATTLWEEQPSGW